MTKLLQLTRSTIQEVLLSIRRITPFSRTLKADMEVLTLFHTNPSTNTLIFDNPCYPQESPANTISSLKNKYMKTLLFTTSVLLWSFSASSQILDPVKWSYAAKRTSTTEATIFFRATLSDGWHIYSQTVPKNGPVKTTFTFIPSKSFRLIGTVGEPEPLTKFEKVFGTKVNYFEKTVIFHQKIKLGSGKVLIKGNIEFMICSDRQCLPPATTEFEIPVD